MDFLSHLLITDFIFLRLPIVRHGGTEMLAVLPPTGGRDNWEQASGSLMMMITTMMMVTMMMMIT